MPPRSVGGPVVKKITSILFALTPLAVALSFASAGAGHAADLPYYPPPPPASTPDWTFRGLDAPRSYVGEFGLRFWFGEGKTGKSLYDPAGSTLVSRLTYHDLMIFS